MSSEVRPRPHWPKLADDAGDSGPLISLANACLRSCASLPSSGIRIRRSCSARLTLRSPGVPVGGGRFLVARLNPNRSIILAYASWAGLHASAYSSVNASPTSEVRCIWRIRSVIVCMRPTHRPQCAGLGVLPDGKAGSFATGPIRTEKTINKCGVDCGSFLPPSRHR